METTMPANTAPLTTPKAKIESTASPPTLTTSQANLTTSKVNIDTTMPANTAPFATSEANIETTSSEPTLTTSKANMTTSQANLTTSKVNIDTTMPANTAPLATSEANIETTSSEPTLTTSKANMTTAKVNIETTVPVTTSPLTTPAQTTLFITNVTTRINSTPLPLSHSYDSVFSFDLHGNVDDVMKQIIRNETARNLNIEHRMVGLLQIASRPSVRRLLSLTASSTITTTSLQESKRIETSLSLDVLNTILGTASGGTVTATNLVISRSYNTFTEDTTVVVTTNSSFAFFVLLGTIGSTVFLLAVSAAYWGWERHKNKSLLVVNGAVFDVAYSDYCRVYSPQVVEYN